MTDADGVFIDTNVLVFATIPMSPFHSRSITALHALAQSGVPVWVSRQVLREYLVQLTRPGVLSSPLIGSVAGPQIDALCRVYRVADETYDVTSALLGLISAGLASGKQVHDANIVATCLAYKIPRLLTHNLTDFKRFSHLVQIDSI